MRQPVYIAAAGVVSPLGSGLAATEDALRRNWSAIAPLNIFPLLQGTPLPVGQIDDLQGDPELPRTHMLARNAAAMAMVGQNLIPDAVILGCTTGGILTTEQLLRDGCEEKSRYRYHSLYSVAEDIALLCQCRGPAVITSTACSSSAVAIALALRLLREGKMRAILAGGVDSLSRLTYYGFHSLQLVDRNICKPLDVNRQGIAVAEGAAMLLLTCDRPQNPLGIVLGAGLSCDAYHPAAPHPEGDGAKRSMQAALADGNLQPEQIDYINLHGTGTPDNDQAEAKAIHGIFATPPPLSSIKGATGHSLATAGALEAIVSTIAISKGFIPGNTGCKIVDPALKLSPQLEPVEKEVRTVLSNSFGFGGNNGSLLFAGSEYPTAPRSAQNTKPLAIHGFGCVTGAGLTEDTFAALFGGRVASGMMPSDELCTTFPQRMVRRVKRLARISLTLATLANEHGNKAAPPRSVFMGTGWGALSETDDFLHSLTESKEQFPSPTDFVGSVHNSPASQIAIHFKATGANVTTCGGDYSFEQALLAADNLLEEEDGALLLAADEGHALLSPLLDPSVDADAALSDGGGALYISRNSEDSNCAVSLSFYGKSDGDTLPEDLFQALGGKERIINDYAAVFVGPPLAMSLNGTQQIADFSLKTGNNIPIWRYRQSIGEFASASAVAAVIAAACMTEGRIPGQLIGGEDFALAAHHKILVLGTGSYITAMTFFKP